MSSYFLVYSAIVAGAVIYGVIRYFPQNKFYAVVAVIAWLIYGGALAYSGVLEDASRRPPGMAFLLVPMIAWIIVISRTRFGKQTAMSFPVKVLIGFQVFRFGVEIFLENLWQAGLVPKMMTFHGTNFDIVIGFSAPLIAYLFAKNILTKKWAIAWNILGVLILANVVGRGFLSTPGPLNLLKDDYANTALISFPYIYIPVLMVTLAITLHILSIRKLLAS